MIKRIIKIIVALAMIVIFGSLAVGAYLAPSDVVSESDAIVVISGGGTERIEHGAELFKLDMAPLLILSGAAHEGDVSNAQAMKQIAMREFQIDESVIITDDAAINTYQNAEGVEEIIKGRDIHHITLVTSAYHQRRAFRTFQEVLGPTIRIDNSPAKIDFWSPYSWWNNKKGRELTLSEFGKIVWSTFTGEYA